MGQAAPTLIAIGLELDPEWRVILLWDMLFARYTSENDLVVSEEEEKENLGTDLPREVRVIGEEAK